MKSLSFRLLLFNVLIIFLPLGSLLYLDTYENQLLASQENSMIQQGRIMASALSGVTVPADASSEAKAVTTLAGEAARILENLKGRVDSRIRVVDAQGNLLADSAVIAPQPYNGSDAAGTAAAADEPSPNASPLYRIAVYPVNVIKRFFFPPQGNYTTGEYYSGRRVLLGPEIQAALEGRYGAATRFSSGGQVSVNLYSAIPILAGADVVGAVLVSRSSYGILLNLYRIRLDIIKIFLISLGVSLVLSLGLSLTITRPIKKLKKEAEQVLDSSGHFRGHIRGLKGKDEIGDLSRSLSALSLKLEKRIAHIDAFTSDLLHELKNPLAAIRGQVELSLSSPNKEAALLRGIAQEETRIERFLSRLRELSRIDNALDREEREPVDLSAFIPLLLDRYSSAKAPAGGIIFENYTAESAIVQVNPDRLTQILTNPLDNALSFSPPEGKITLTLQKNEAQGTSFFYIMIDDQGPGIRDETGDRYFERFYSERPQDDRENHSGLGLAIVRTILQGYGGFCSLKNRVEGGCRFTLALPVLI